MRQVDRDIAEKAAKDPARDRAIWQDALNNPNAAGKVQEIWNSLTPAQQAKLMDPGFNKLHPPAHEKMSAYERAALKQQSERNMGIAERANQERIYGNVKDGVIQSRPNPGHATADSIRKIASDFGIKPESALDALKGVVSRGQQPTDANVKYFISRMREQGLFKPEVE
jgi:hypothetical protein